MRQLRPLTMHTVCIQLTCIQVYIEMSSYRHSIQSTRALFSAHSTPQFPVNRRQNPRAPQAPFSALLEDLHLHILQAINLVLLIHHRPNALACSLKKGCQVSKRVTNSCNQGTQTLRWRSCTRGVPVATEAASSQLVRYTGRGSCAATNAAAPQRPFESYRCQPGQHEQGEA